MKSITKFRKKITVGVWSELSIPGKTVGAYMSGQVETNIQQINIIKDLDSVKLRLEEEIENKYNCDITWRLLDKSLMTRIGASIKSGEHLADILLINPSMKFLALASNNLLVPRYSAKSNR